MDQAIRIVIQILVVSGIVLLCFFLFKNRTSATIEPTDKSMDPVTFPDGSYRVDTSIDKLSGLKPGDVVAYKVPKDPASIRIARVIGTEGMRVEVTQAEVRSNGTPLARRFETAKWTIPETKVPRGCLYLLADSPFSAQDSKTVGPVPFTNVIGTVKASK